jgi:hypothetical protein
LKFNHRLGIVPFPRLFGFEIEHLPADHAAQTGRARQSENERNANPRVRVGCGVRHHIECIGEQAIAGKDRGRFVESLVRCRPPTSQIVVIEGRKIIMDERVAMDHFNGRRRAQDTLAFGAKKARGLDREKRPEPLAAAKTRVAHGFEKSRRPDRLARKDGRA